MNDRKCIAAAPTGIAAANIEVEGSDIHAATLHNVFDLDSACNSSLDFTKLGAEKVGPPPAQVIGIVGRGPGDSEFAGARSCLSLFCVHVALGVRET